MGKDVRDIEAGSAFDATKYAIGPTDKVDLYFSSQAASAGKSVKTALIGGETVTFTSKVRAGLGPLGNYEDIQHVKTCGNHEICVIRSAVNYENCVADPTVS